MIEVGKINCPVCASNAGLGRELDSYGPAGAGTRIQPCRYPWQTPIGILNADVSSETGSNVEVRFNGTFELRWNNNTSGMPPTDADIYGCGASNRAMIGERVYYDAKHSIYVTEHATNCTKTSTNYGNWIGCYPGAATVGYISAWREDPDVTNAGWVTITIDPRPARATYRVCAFDPTSAPLLLPVMGMQVTVLTATKVAVPYDADMYGDTCDGVIAGVAGMYGESIYWVVVCTAGPAWIFPTKNTLYHDVSHRNLEEMGYPSENVPINTLLSFSPFGKSGEYMAPRIGYAHMKQWYNQAPMGSNDDPAPYYVIIDINTEAPTPYVPVD